MLDCLRARITVSMCGASWALKVLLAKKSSLDYVPSLFVRVTLMMLALVEALKDPRKPKYWGLFANFLLKYWAEFAGGG